MKLSTIICEAPNFFMENVHLDLQVSAGAAGLKTLDVIEHEDPYQRMTVLIDEMAETINKGAKGKGVPLRCVHLEGVFTIFATDRPFHNLADVRQCDTGLYARLFHKLMDQGFYIQLSRFEVAFVSDAHTREQVMDFAQHVVDAL